MCAVHNIDSVTLGNSMSKIHDKSCFLLDMDGVIYHGERLLPGIQEFLAWLVRHEKKFLFLTNGSRLTPRELKERLERMGINVSEDHFHTSAISSAMFLDSQCPRATAYVIGGNGLKEALDSIGYRISDISPDYVVVGETSHYNFELIEKAVNLVLQGSKLIATNCDVIDNADQGVTPACGSLVAPIERATGTLAYFVGRSNLHEFFKVHLTRNSYILLIFLGKPNPLMFRTALRKLNSHSGDCVMIGDRMETDIMGGMEAGMDTILVLSGVTRLADLKKFAFRPTFIMTDLLELTQFLERFSTGSQKSIE